MVKGKRKSINRGPRAEYDYHLPVLAEQSVDMLVNNIDGLYIDGTMGGGGHTQLILQKLSKIGKVLAFDKDPDAIKRCSLRFESELLGDSSPLSIFNFDFAKACSIAKELLSDKKNAELWGKLSGLLLDLGVSSHQLDSGNRGISYRIESPLDMRFGTEGITAKELLHAAEENELIRIMRSYGEEPFARVIARRLIEKRRAGSLVTTFDLKDAVISSVPTKLQLKSLSRVFQAFRIAVNKELDVLENTIASCVPLLEKGGRIVIIAYHSLEDKIVKNLFKKYSAKSKEATGEELLYGNSVKIEPLLKVLTPKPIIPSQQEIELNPRSRSAIMRVAEKV